MLQELPIRLRSLSPKVSEQVQTVQNGTLKRKLEIENQIDALTEGIKKMRLEERLSKNAWELLEDMVWDENTGLLYGKWKSK